MKVSVKNIVILAAIALVPAACGKKEKELSPREIRLRADSIAQSKVEKLRQQAREDLDRRLPIELKPKVDSLLKMNHDIEPVPVFPEDDDPVDVVDSGKAPLPKARVKDTAKK